MAKRFIVKIKIDKNKLKLLKHKLINKYPHLLCKKSRVAKMLNNIYIFTNYIAEDRSLKTESLFLASVLLASQDEYMDNGNIDYNRKKEYIKLCNRIIKENNFTNHQQNNTEKELLEVWKQLLRYKNIQKSKLWRTIAIALNNAMLKESDKSHQSKHLNSYLQNAQKSIGYSFIIASFLLYNKIGEKEIKTTDRLLNKSDMLIRIFNDLGKSDREDKVSLKNFLSTNKEKEKIKIKYYNEFYNALDKMDAKLSFVKYIENGVEFCKLIYDKGDFSRKIYAKS